MKTEPDETDDWEPILAPRKTKKVPKLKVPESENLNNPVEVSWYHMIKFLKA